MNQDQLNTLVKCITAFATAFVVILVGIITFQRIKINNANKHLTNLDNEIAQMTTTKSTLETEIENSKSPTYIEEMLRDQLIIKDNETYFEVTEK